MLDSGLIEWEMHMIFVALSLSIAFVDCLPLSCYMFLLCVD